MTGFLLFGGIVLLAIGAWTVAHPNGGYRAVGGAGSGLSASTRRTCGWLLSAFAVVVIATAPAVASWLTT